MTVVPPMTSQPAIGGFAADVYSPKRCGRFFFSVLRRRLKCLASSSEIVSSSALVGRICTIGAKPGHLNRTLVHRQAGTAADRTLFLFCNG